MNKFLKICPHCGITKSHKGISTHIARAHGTAEQKQKYNSRFPPEMREKIKEDRLQRNAILEKEYNLNCCHCKQCNTPLSYKDRNKIFCNRSCSAKFNNNARPPHSDEIKRQIAESVKVAHAKKRIEKSVFKENFVGPIFQKQKVKKVKLKITPEKEEKYDFCRVFICKCKFCRLPFIKQTSQIICKDCKITKKKMYVDFRFKFNVYDYPDLFDLEKLKSIGWFSPGGKSGKWNIEGLSRDHKVSVSNAIKNNYDPYYISHPMNCDLIPHKENNKKKTKSSISYEELILMVEKYETAKARNGQHTP